MPEPSRVAEQYAVDLKHILDTIHPGGVEGAREPLRYSDGRVLDETNAAIAGGLWMHYTDKGVPVQQRTDDAGPDNPS